MKKIMVILMHWLMSLIGIVFASITLAMAQSVPDVKVGVYAQHVGGKLVYHYRTINNSSDSIASMRIGYDPKNDVWELFELPAEWDSILGIPPANATSPLGWRVYVITPEETETHAITWRVIDNNSPRILPGQTLNGMSVTLDKADINYLTAHAVINTTLTVPLERLDTTPPTLTITPTPATLWPPNNKLVPITTAITVKDDYDPQPEIKLESITSSEMLGAGEIQDAQLGTDDRSFYLAATREGNNMAGRIYTLTYSATDGSGNKATASTTVTVPHDQR